MPPHSTSPMVLPAKREGLLSTAASPAAPAPSTTVFSICNSSATAFSSAGSSTSRMSSTRSAITFEVKSPGTLTAIPSASVSPPQGRLAPLILSNIEGNSAACTPTTCMAGLAALATVAMPEISPPPPIGVTMQSISGITSSISSATVPAPAATCGSSKG